MKYFHKGVIAIFVLIPIVLGFVAYKYKDMPSSTTELVQQVEDGTVLIANEIDTTNGGIGTGFILSDNQIVTNHHVVDGNGKLFVYSSNSERKYPVEVVYKDEIADLAVLRIVDWEVYKKNENPVNLTLGNSDEMRVGDKVIVIGHPWGLTWSVSEGILSSKNRRMGPNPKFMDQVDAKLYQGNSGGPIFNEDGEIICVSNMMVTKEGGSYGFCIPSDLVRKVIHDLNTHKEVRWRILNISVDLTEDGSYVKVSSLDADGAAAKAGIKEGDAILEIITPNNHPKGVKITNPYDLITELATLDGSDELVKLVIMRNGEKKMIDVKTNYKLSSDYTPNAGK